MAEIWYLESETESLEGQVKHERSFIECIDILELDPEGWESESGAVPNLLTGDPFVDGCGRITLCVRVLEDELEPFPDKRWKPGWYKSPVTIVGMETKLRLKAK